MFTGQINVAAAPIKTMLHLVCHSEMCHPSEDLIRCVCTASIGSVHGLMSSHKPHLYQWFKLVYCTVNQSNQVMHFHLL